MEAETVVQTGRAASLVAHVKENNIGYLLGCLIAHQLGLLNTVFTYGQAICS